MKNNKQEKKQTAKPRRRAKAKGRKFTVLLRWPDYLGDYWPDDTFHCWLRAGSVEEAVAKAQAKGQKASLTKIERADDLVAVSVKRGWLIEYV